MSTPIIELPKGDSIDGTVELQKADGSPLDCDSALLTVQKAGSAGGDYTLSLTPNAGVAPLVVPAGALAIPGSFAASVVAKKGTTEQGTLAFILKVTDHA